ncbi:MAG: VOC family protein [Galactobacter sp.]|uniref:VOC family protein n=1 Tax=Galactobacter sp. TaxID=2676125 RepID=UPI0025BAD06C|nr:VOC family protein [Galactobacter sp.]
MTHLQPHRIVTALDCPDAVALGTFYAELLGWELKTPGPDEPDFADPEWVAVVRADVGEHAFSLGFQRVHDFERPTWPEGPVPQQAHLDFWVDDLEASGEVALGLGATRHDVQPSEDGGFVVYLDPVGHPFCLCRA